MSERRQTDNRRGVSRTVRVMPEKLASAVCEDGGGHELNQRNEFSPAASRRYTALLIP